MDIICKSKPIKSKLNQKKILKNALNEKHRILTGSLDPKEIKLHFESIANQSSTRPIIIATLPMVTQIKLECASFAAFGARILGDGIAELKTMANYYDIHGNELKTKNLNHHQYPTQFSKAFESISTKLLDVSLACEYMNISNGVLGGLTNHSWDCLQYVSSLEIENICNHWNQNVTVVEHPTNIMKRIEDGEVTMMFDNVYKQLKNKDTSLPIICNTKTSGYHWRCFIIFKRLSNIIIFTVESLDWSHGGGVTIQVSRQLLNAIIHSYTFYCDYNLRRIICNPLRSLKRSLKRINPGTDDFMSAFGSELIGIINDTDKWMNDLIIIKFNVTPQSIETMAIEIKETLNSISALTNGQITDSKAKEMFDLLSTTTKNRLINIILFRIKDSMKNEFKNLQILTGNIQNIFHNDNIFLDFILNSIKYINSMNLDGIINFDQTQYNALQIQIVNISQKIKDFCYHNGWMIMEMIDQDIDIGNKNDEDITNSLYPCPTETVSGDWTTTVKCTWNDI